jgi:hypothetical protein
MGTDVGWWEDVACLGFGASRHLTPDPIPAFRN